MRILLVQGIEDLRERLHFAIEGTFGATVTDAADRAFALKLLAAADSAFDLIIYDLPVGSPQEIEELKKARPTMPILLCVESKAKAGAEASEKGLAGFVDRAALIENLTDEMESLIQRNVLPKPVTDQKYCRIRAKLLLSFCPLKADIFIRLSEWKFIKLFREGDVFDAGDMEKYVVKKGVEYLYLLKENSREFIEKYTADLRKLLAAPKLGVEESAKAGETAFEAIQELGYRLGFTREVQELAKTQVQVTLKSIGKSPRLVDIINKMKNARGEYIASHSMICGYLACAIAAQMKWGSDMTFYKLTLAAFLHDVSLRNQDLAALETLQDLEREKARFTDEELKAYRSHPLKSAEVSRQFSEVPPDVDTIILQHHERPEGTGFPRGLGGAYIAPLAAVFIVAHDLARRMVLSPSDSDLATFLASAKDRYKGSQFKKVLVAMEGLGV